MCEIMDCHGPLKASDLAMTNIQGSFLITILLDESNRAKLSLKIKVALSNTQLSQNLTVTAFVSSLRLL